MSIRRTLVEDKEPLTGEERVAVQVALDLMYFDRRPVVVTLRRVTDPPPLLILEIGGARVFELVGTDITYRADRSHAAVDGHTEEDWYEVRVGAIFLEIRVYRTTLQVTLLPFRIDQDGRKQLKFAYLEDGRLTLPA